MSESNKKLFYFWFLVISSLSNINVFLVSVSSNMILFHPNLMVHRRENVVLTYLQVIVIENKSSISL